MNISSMVAKCPFCGMDISITSLNTTEGIILSHDYDAAVLLHQQNECPALASVRTGDATLIQEPSSVINTNLTPEEGLEIQQQEVRMHLGQTSSTASENSSTGGAVSKRRAFIRRRRK